MPVVVVKITTVMIKPLVNELLMLCGLEMRFVAEVIWKRDEINRFIC